LLHAGHDLHTAADQPLRGSRHTAPTSALACSCHQIVQNNHSGAPRKMPAAASRKSWECGFQPGAPQVRCEPGAQVLRYGSSCETLPDQAGSKTGYELCCLPNHAAPRAMTVERAQAFRHWTVHFLLLGSGRGFRLQRPAGDLGVDAEEFRFIVCVRCGRCPCHWLAAHSGLILDAKMPATGSQGARDVRSGALTQMMALLADIAVLRSRCKPRNLRSLTAWRADPVSNDNSEAASGAGRRQRCCVERGSSGSVRLTPDQRSDSVSKRDFRCRMNPRQVGPVPDARTRRVDLPTEVLRAQQRVSLPTRDNVRSEVVRSSTSFRLNRVNTDIERDFKYVQTRDEIDIVDPPSQGDQGAVQVRTACASSAPALGGLFYGA